MYPLPFQQTPKSNQQKTKKKKLQLYQLIVLLPKQILNYRVVVRGEN